MITLTKMTTLVAQPSSNHSLAFETRLDRPSLASSGCETPISSMTIGSPPFM
jgi:hypothetical protein